MKGFLCLANLNLMKAQNWKENIWNRNVDTKPDYDEAKTSLLYEKIYKGTSCCWYKFSKLIFLVFSTTRTFSQPGECPKLLKIISYVLLNFPVKLANSTDLSFLFHSWDLWKEYLYFDLLFQHFFNRLFFFGDQTVEKFK